MRMINIALIKASMLRFNSEKTFIIGCEFPVIWVTFSDFSGKDDYSEQILLYSVDRKLNTFAIE